MSAKKPEQYRPTRDSLLHELEDLKLSLSLEEPETMPIKEEPTEVPALTDTQSLEELTPPDHLIQEDEDGVEREKEEKPENTATDSERAPLGQQPLFDDEVSDKSHDHNASNKDENPFLPEHIRERLTQNKNTILEELAHVGESLSKHRNRAKIGKEADADANILIDELVAKYLPQIEKELRAKLKQQLKQ